jgi:GNAT superfamily N-acetyltransferase
MSPRAARAKPKLAFHPLTPERWPDLKQLFGRTGACGGCWCMWWRLSHSEFERRKGEKNRRAFKRIVDSGIEPGLLAYLDNEPVAWCAIQPREAFPRMENSRILKPVDDLPVWCVPCLFVAKEQRRTGVSIRMLEAAVRHARKNGAKIVEGYPVEPKKGRAADAFVWTGTASAFRKAGFEEVARRSETRPIMRYHLKRRR